MKWVKYSTQSQQSVRNSVCGMLSSCTCNGSASCYQYKAEIHIGA